MKIIRNSKVRGFILAAAFSAGLGFGASASAHTRHEFTAGGTFHALSTDPNGMGMRDVGTLDGTGNSGAVGINNTGQVVVYSRTWTDNPAPIPEPESYALFLAGLALVGFIARRKKMSGKAFTRDSL